MPFVIGTAGHIDHGKTALVKALTGIDTDTLKEEKKRGLSIDLGFAYLDIPGCGRVSIIDAPGHERFIKNMLAGTTGIDCVLFAVAADDGVMPQTLEHLQIVHLLGIKKGVFAVTKSDLVEPERLAAVKNEVRGLIDRTILKGSEIIEVSSVTGTGMERLKKHIEGLCAESQGRAHESGESDGFFRLPVDRSFTLKGFGTVVTGTVADGALSAGQNVFLYPEGRELRVRGIQSHYRPVAGVVKGERAAVNLSAISPQEVKRGDMLVSTDLPFKQGVRVFDCVIESSGTPVKNRSLLKLYHLTGSSVSAVQFLERRGMKPGEKTRARAHLKTPLLMLRGDRFILRDPSINKTVAGGEVVVPYISKKYMPRFSLAGGICSGDGVAGEGGRKGQEEIIAFLLKEKSVIEKEALCFMLNIRKDALEKVLSCGGPKGGFKTVGNSVVSGVFHESLRNSIIETISGYHKKHPGDAGIKIEELLNAKTGALRLLRNDVMEGLIKEGVLKKDGFFVLMACHRPRLEGPDKDIEGRILKTIGRGFEATAVGKLESLPFKKADMDRVLDYLIKQGAVSRLKPGVFISKEAVDSAVAILKEKVEKSGSVSAAEFRDILGCGRKLAIEMLEYFDRMKITVRKGDTRTLR